jgi:hypothetical protein
MLQRNRVSLAIAAAAMCCLLGCERRAKTVHIHGLITFEGKPIEKGVVTFLPSDGRGRTGAGLIADGRYSAEIPPGPKQVQIQGFRIVGRQHAEPANPNSRMIDVQEQVLPDRYNTNSTLTCEITPGGSSQDFSLK